MSNSTLICWFGELETFLILLNYKKMLYNDEFWWIESSKDQSLLDTEIFSNIINVITDTFELMYSVFQPTLWMLYQLLKEL